jgi:hypothetical protein
MADLVATEVAREGAVTGGTHESQARSWKRYIKYVHSIGLSVDPFLDELNRGQRNHIMCCFPWLCVKDDFQDRIMNDWLIAQSTVPSRMFVRPSGKIVDKTLPKTKTYSLASFYKEL